MNSLAGTGLMLRHVLRRDRVLGTAWVLFLALLVVGVAKQYAGLFPTDRARLDFVAEVRANAALNAFTGQLHGDGLGNLVLWKTGDIAFTLIGLMAVLLVVRHTRAEEESGRAELVGAGVLGRFATLTASLLAVSLLSVLAGALSAVGLAAFGLDAAGSAAFGLALIAPGLVFAAVGAVAAQLSERARGAIAIASTVLGIGYLIRFVADGSGLLWLRWLSPNGWSHLAEPFGGNHVGVLAVPLAVASLLVALAFRLAARRDVGAGALPARLGPPTAVGRLRSPLALAWRLHRGQIFGWTVALSAFSAATAAVATGMPELASRSGEHVREFFHRYAATPDAGIADTFIWLIIVSIAGVAALYPMMAVLRLRAEETGGRAEMTLATPTSRLRWAGGHLLCAAAGSALMLAASGLAAGLVYGITSGDVPTQLPGALSATLVQIPPVWLIGSLAVIAVGAFPRLATAFVWVVFMLVNLFGESLGPILGIDYGYANQVVPFHHVPKILTGGEFTAAPLLIMTLLAVVFAATGLAALNRRDIR
ncbi:ABC transporter permease [Saccharopolyspora indica]|uniref:ABC transporter permease n=1 Tax=Saccharopolyspora indica TaxID=1229659 RepID=UPI0022EA1BA2|nr:ABC transporter permease [Saccharopolyspora indica]MDA3647934.1 ABC transporter permease [Saccharopolyspora indica]